MCNVSTSCQLTMAMIKRSNIVFKKIYKVNLSIGETIILCSLNLKLDRRSTTLCRYGNPSNVYRLFCHLPKRLNGALVSNPRHTKPSRVTTNLYFNQSFSLVDKVFNHCFKLLWIEKKFVHHPVFLQFEDVIDTVSTRRV